MRIKFKQLKYAIYEEGFQILVYSDSQVRKISGFSSKHLKEKNTVKGAILPDKNEIIINGSLDLKEKVLTLIHELKSPSSGHVYTDQDYEAVINETIALRQDARRRGGRGLNIVHSKFDHRLGRLEGFSKAPPRSQGTPIETAVLGFLKSLEAEQRRSSVRIWFRRRGNWLLQNYGKVLIVVVIAALVGTGWGKPVNENEAKTIFTPATN